MSVPQAEVLGVTLPDPELALDPETGHYRFGAIDWDEFKRVISGNGPVQRRADRPPPRGPRRQRLGDRGGHRLRREARAA